jgi:AbrB family looped-hinge helix DNA binding protein
MWQSGARRMTMLADRAPLRLMPWLGNGRTIFEGDRSPEVTGMSTPARLLRVDEDCDEGQVALPVELREKLGLKRGDMVSVVETPDGLLLTSRRAEIERDLARVDAELAEHGLSLDDLVESGREIRGDLIKERYGLDG